MVSSPELVAYLLSNALVLLGGGALSGLSLAAYRRSDRESFLLAAIGFALITLGSVVEAIYEIGIRGDFAVSGSELLVLHAVEGVIIALGLGALFLSLHRH